MRLLLNKDLSLIFSNKIRSLCKVSFMLSNFLNKNLSSIFSNKIFCLCKVSVVLAIIFKSNKYLICSNYECNIHIICYF